MRYYFSKDPQDLKIPDYPIWRAQVDENGRNLKNGKLQYVVCHQCGEVMPVSVCKKDIARGWLCIKCIECRHIWQQENFKFTDGTKVDETTKNPWDIVVDFNRDFIEDY